MQFSYNTSKTPYIYFSIVKHSQDNLWSPVITTLNVSINGLSFKATGTKINNFNSWFIHFFEKYIFWFEISMYNFVTMEEVDSIQNLQYKSSD
jgi:hypothetical protein